MNELLTVGRHDANSPLAIEETQTAIGRIVPAWHEGHDLLMAKLDAGDPEVLWYPSLREDTTTRGRLLRLDATDRIKVLLEAPEIVAVVEWWALSYETSESESTFQVLTENEYREVRENVPSAVIHDVIAAGKRGAEAEGETLQRAVQRLTVLMTGDDI